MKYNDSVAPLSRREKNELILSHVYRGIAYYQKGEYNRAIDDLNKALELKSDFALVYGYRGLAYAGIGELDLAIRDFSRTIQSKPKSAYTYANRGIAYQKKGEIDLAIKDFSKAIELFPYYAEAHNRRGLIYRNTGDFDKAIADFSQAILGNSINAYYHRAIVWLRLQKWENAHADFATARKKKLDIAAKFQSKFGSIADFERDFGVNLPEDIADMLMGE